MSGSLTFALAIVVLSALIAVDPAAAAPPTPSDQASSPAVLVTLAETADPRAAESLLLSRPEILSVQWLAPLPVLRAVLAPGATAATVADDIRWLPRVRAAEVDGEQRLVTVPNDELYRPFQWNLRRIGAETLWDLRPTAPEMVVAVLDTGADYTHPDLRPNLVLDGGYDFINDVPGAQDDESHGTSVAGVIGAVGNNGDGVAGVAWRIRVLPIKTLNARGRGPDSAMVRAIVYAADAGARIINISSTGSRYSAALERAVRYAQEKGALVIAAAGNSGDVENEVTYPAAFPGVLAIAAVDESDRVPSFSQHGTYIGLAAPGVDIPTTIWPGAGRGLYASQTGTSMAAPHASGVAALLWALRPDLSADEIAAAMRSTADDIGPPGPDPASGNGVLNAAKALRVLRLGVPASTRLEVSPGAAPAPAAEPALPFAAPAPLPPDPRRWYFAEGSTNPPFETWFALQNAADRPVLVRFTFLSPAGRQTVREMLVPPSSRTSLRANDILPNAEFSTIVQADGPVFVERSMYFGHDGHSAAGAREPARAWYLAEGSTVAPFDTWLLLMNPNPSPTPVQLRFMLEDGTASERTELLPAWGRTSLYANLLFSAAGFATRVTADQPIVVERAMYFDGGQGGHDTVATPAPNRSWYLAEGASRGGFDTWVLVQNPGTRPATIRVTFITDDGRLVVQPLLVQPQARASLLSNIVIPNAAYGIRVESDEPVVVERAVYFNGGRAGFDSAAVTAPAREWYLPEGSTLGSFVEQIALLNPQAQPANVQIDLRRQDGEIVAAHRVRLRPTSRLTLDVNPLAHDAIVSVRVTADQPIVAERTLYFSTPTGVGATNSVGLTR